MESKDQGLQEVQAVESKVAEKIGDMADKVVDDIKEAVQDMDLHGDLRQSDSAFDQGMSEMFDRMDAPKGDLDKADKMADNQDSVKGSEQEQSR